MESRRETEKKTTRNLQIMTPCHGTLFFLTLLSLSRVDLDVTPKGFPKDSLSPPLPMASYSAKLASNWDLAFGKKNKDKS